MGAIYHADVLRKNPQRGAERQSVIPTAGDPRRRAA